MPAYHITGPNGSGKSTVGRVLAARGFKVVESDFEPGFSSWVNTESGEKVTNLPAQPVPKKWLATHAWRWDKEKVHEIIETVNEEPVFIVGGASNEKEFYRLFKKRFGFFIDDDTLVRRLRIREPKRWVEGSAELENSLGWNKRSAEFNLSHGAVPIDGSRDPEINADIIVRYVKDISLGAMKKICVFDVNETLLDLKALDPQFERVFGDASVRAQWFSQFIQSALVSIVTDSYTPFGTIGSAAFDMVAARRNVTVKPEDKQSIMQSIASLPPHPEVKRSLAKLKDAGFKIASLTNSTQIVVDKQLANAGIAEYFDKILSVEAVKKLKPAKEAYEFAAKSFDVELSNIRLIASHAWDIAGALRAGCDAAFIARPGMVLDPLVENPHIVGSDLEEVADKIIAADS